MKLGLKKLSAIVLALIFATATVYALSLTYTINNTGKIIASGIEVFEDAACTIPLASIDWGQDLRADDVVITDCYLKNTGDIRIEITSVEALNFDPSYYATELGIANDFLGRTFLPGDASLGQITLAIPSNPTRGTFAFDIIITAVEAPL